MKLQSLERTYVDKIFALCDYYLQGKSKRYSRHLYDIYKLAPMMEINDDFSKLVDEIREHRAKMPILQAMIKYNSKLRNGIHKMLGDEDEDNQV